MLKFVHDAAAIARRSPFFGLMQLRFEALARNVQRNTSSPTISPSLSRAAPNCTLKTGRTPEAELELSRAGHVFASVSSIVGLACPHRRPHSTTS